MVPSVTCFRARGRGVKQGLYRYEGKAVANGKNKERKRRTEKERDILHRGIQEGLPGGSNSVAGRARVNKRPSAVMAASATSDAFRWLFSPGCLDVA